MPRSCVLPLPAATRRDAVIADLLNGPAIARGEQRRMAELLADLIATRTCSEDRALRAYAWLHARYHAHAADAMSVGEFVDVLRREVDRLEAENAGADVEREVVA